MDVDRINHANALAARTYDVGDHYCAPHSSAFLTG